MRHICAILLWLTVPGYSVTRVSAAVHELPFILRDGFIWVEATSPASTKPLNLLIDSGAQLSVINSSTAIRLGMSGGRPVPVMGVGNSTTGYWPQKATIRAGTIELPGLYLVMDLRELSEACTNAPIDGIIGADFFRKRIVQLDYQRGVLRLLTEAPKAGSGQILSLKVRPCGMLVPLRINDSKPQWVRLDTGCASALQWVTGSIRPEDCTRRVAVALTKLSLSVTRTRVTIGTERFEDVPTDLHTREIFPGEKGILGNGLLSRFKTVTVDAKGGKLILQ